MFMDRCGVNKLQLVARALAWKGSGYASLAYATHQLMYR
jgi:hypothetical protein